MNIPDNAKPISIDIKSMYGNIPLQEGLVAFEEALNSREDKSVSTDFVMKLVKLVMEKNTLLLMMNTGYNCWELQWGAE